MSSVNLMLAMLAGASQAPAQESQKQISSAPTVQELTVTAGRAPVQTLIDRKVYTVTTDLQAGSGVAADVLNRIPSVNVDPDGGVTLRGQGSVTILVDGKPSAQFSGAAQGMSLLQFPAGEIDRIEVLTNPPSQYRAEGTGGVINIVTRKTHRSGMSGVTRVNLGDMRRFVASLDGAYNQNRLRLSGGIGLRQEAKERLVTSDRTTLDALPSPAQATQSLDEWFRRLIPSAKVALAYDLTTSRTVDISFDHRELSGNRYFDQHNVAGPIGIAATSISDRHSDGYEWSVDDNKAISFEQKLGRPNETLTISAQRGAVRERERYAYRNTYSLPTADPRYDHLYLSLDLIKTQFSLDYDLPMASSRELRLGLSEEADQNAFDNRGDTVTLGTGAIVSNPDITNHFRYRQMVHAAYVDFQTLLGPYHLDAGARLEASSVSTRQITGGISGGYESLALYPSLNLKRSLSDDDTLTASVSRRVNRPDPESLNPFADHQDTHNLRAGNPDLRPQETWLVEAGYAHEGPLNYAATAFFRQDRNSFTEVVRPISADVVLTTKANLPRQRSGGLEFSARGKLGTTLTYGISGVAFQMQIDPSGLGLGRQKSTSGLNLKFNLDYRPTALDAAQFSFNRTDKRLTPQGQIDAINLVNFGYKHDFRPDLSLVVTVSDLLNSQRTIRRNASDSLVETFQRHQYGRIGYVGLTYTFGGPKKGKSSFDYEQ